MKAVILAAGIGRRLAGAGWGKPKCLLPCPQGTLLDNAIASALAVGVTEFVIVVGFQRERVMEAARAHEAQFDFVFNERFASTNTLYSLSLAGDRLRDGFWLFNGDVWFRREVLDRLKEFPGSALAVEAKLCGEEEVKVVVDSTNRIRGIGKALNPAECLGEYVGVAKFDASCSRAFLRQLKSLTAANGSDGLYYESVLDAILKEKPITAARLSRSEAIEIDTPSDLESARALW